MKIFLVYLILFPSLVFSTALCEGELSLKARAVVGILRQALSRQQLSLSALKSFAISETWRSPLDDSDRIPENLAFKRTFDRLSRNISDRERAQVKSESLALVREETAKDEKVSETRENTRVIIDVRLIPTTRSQGQSRSGENSISIGWVDGYPVIGAKVHFPVGKLRTIHILPFPLPPRNLMGLTGTTDESSPQPPAFFEKKGIAYSFLMDRLYFQDIKSNDSLWAKDFGFKNSADYLAEESLVIQTSKGAKLFFTGHRDSARFKGKLVMLDLENPAAEPVIILNGDARRLSEQKVGDRKFLAFQGPYVTGRIYDVENNYLYPAFIETFGSTHISANPLALYEDQGRLKVVVAAKEEGSQSHIRVFDVETGNLQRTTRHAYMVAFGLYHFDKNGVPYVYFSTLDSLRIVNLRDMTERVIDMQQFRTSLTGAIKINGRIYIPGVHFGQSLVLVDIETPGNIFSGFISSQSRESHLFRFREKIYAVVTDKSDLPQLVGISLLETPGEAR